MSRLWAIRLASGSRRSLAISNQKLSKPFHAENRRAAPSAPGGREFFSALPVESTEKGGAGGSVVDMSCHPAGSARLLLSTWTSLTNKEVGLEGTSGLGPDAIAPRLLVLCTPGGEHEHYYLGRSADELRAIVTAASR